MYPTITHCHNMLMCDNQWIREQFFKVNVDKTKVLLVGPKSKRDTVLGNVGNMAHHTKTKVTSLGVILDADLTSY